MSIESIGLIGLGILLLLMFLDVPVAICMFGVGVVGLVILIGSSPALSLTGLGVLASLSDYTLAVLPVFLLMGEFADISGMMGDAYRGLAKLLGNLRGGLAMASILGAAGFSAVSGSSMATAAIMSRVALPRLLEHKYDPALATGALCAGGTLGNLIPPGILLVIYASMTDVSLGKLMVACMVPGIVLTVMYLVQIYVQCKLKPSLGPGAGRTTWKEKLFATKYIAAVFVVFALVMGGIYFGVYTPNEAASFGTAFVFLYAVIRRKVNGQTVVQALKNTTVTTGMAFAIVVGASIFANFIALSQIPQTLTTLIVGLNMSAIQVIIAMMVIYLILGVPLSALTMMLLTIPIFLPVLNAYKIDLLWFGVLLVIQMELANISPPVGMNLFVTAAVAKPYGVSMGTVFRGALPFCVTMLVFNALLVAFPQIALYPVSLMKVAGG